jgi:hypothetical protein
MADIRRDLIHGRFRGGHHAAVLCVDEHPFGTIKARMGATHFLMRTLPRVAAEKALHVLAYNMTRAMSIMGVRPLLAAIRA